MTGIPLSPGVTRISCVNTESEAAPPHAILAVFEVEYDEATNSLRFKARKPAQTDVDFAGTIWVFNGPVEIPAGKPGACVLARHQPAWGLLDPDMEPTDLDPDDKPELGPIDGQWFLSEDGRGFQVAGFRPDPDDPGRIHDQRALVIERGSPAGTTFKVITGNVALDDFSISVGALTDADGRSYVEAKRADKYTGEVSGDAVRLYPGKGMSGILVWGQVVSATTNGDPKGWVAYGPALLDANGDIVDGGSTTVTVKIFAGTEAEVTVDAVSEHEDDFADDQHVSITWQRVAEDRSQFRVSDASCPD